jgi:threonine dehydrogenase-like Zn-dependent dehydrogenase
MKALCLQALRQVELIDVLVPQIAPDQLLIKTGAATICTSDIADIRENPFNIPLPVTIGHEAAGTVAAVGAAVSGFRVGDRVATSPVHPCGQCQPCRDGLSHLCLEMGHYGINMPGTMAEYYIVRQDRAVLLPESVSFALASLAEPVSVCLEALAQANLRPGANLLIVGDGPFGVLISRLAEALPLAKTVLAGRMAFRLSFAGKAITLNTEGQPDPARAILNINHDAGYDAAILAVSSAEAFATCLQCIRPKGRVVVFSALPGQTPVDLFTLHLKEMEIVGACNEQDRFGEAVKMLAEPALGIERLITHRFALEDFRQALQLAEFGREQAMKVTFTF